MKKITIGRGRECDIRIDDSTDTVSRRQAVITVTPTGKMEIYDTSSNGTFVNGKKVEKPNGMPVKRGDLINFAHVADLDWNKVKDPYKSMKIMVVVAFLVAVITAVILLLLANRTTEPEPVEPEPAVVEAVDSTLTDSVTLNIPKETPTPGPVTNPNSNSKKQEKGINTKKNTGEMIKDLNKSKKVENSEPSVNEPTHDPRLDDAINKQR